ncbi:acetyl-CoA synthetase-like protein [Pseudovirgaria hyperparasitica]|uniref:Acetyl-CoA synthetase-like protein n=1 Tax=Pseudovirgaria hyperparasitica TaxID=470096 RepID=A0A6A6W519_9PEZI|nr:acetyl-CoA synthetase-like protein [Pseudovirgaria hyperparasitica]KAF2757134.1 acetyl-CoA synthetase-like protein [Pseudovirgaria hyperparasitica]
MAESHPELERKLQELDHELEDGDITRKGYEKRRTILLSQFLGPGIPQPPVDIQVQPAEDDGASYDGQSVAPLRTSSMISSQSQYAQNPQYAQQPQYAHQSQYAPQNQGPYGGRQSSGEYMAYPPSQVGRFQERQLGIRNNSMQSQRQSSFGGSVTPDTFQYSREGTMVNSDYAFNPANEPGYQDHGGDSSRMSTMLESQQGYFSDFAGQQAQEPRESYGGPNRYSTGDAFSPTAAVPPPMLDQYDLPSIECQLPLEPRDVPFAVNDPHNAGVPMAKFDNLAAVLRHRGRTNQKQTAYWVIDPKGKETQSITWEKLASRAEKVAKVIRDKSNLYRGDRVALVYRDNEIIDFAVALLGCFIAGVVAVPMNSVDDYQKLSLLLTTTQAHLALTTENNLKAFHRDISQNRLKWPTGVEWWKTNEFGSYQPRKHDDVPPLQVPDLAYIEFSRAPTGDLRGVVLSHRTIMHQMACMSAIISTIPTTGSASKDTFNTTLRDRNGNLINTAGAPKSSGAEVIMSYLDPREGAGLIMGVLLGVYGGHTTVWMEARTVETPGLYAYLISKYRTTIIVGDYPGLKRSAYNYQQDPMATRNFKKNMEPNFATLKICLIDTLTVDSEFHEVLGDRWLKPLRNPRGKELVAPMLCLPEHGGMIISVRDWLGGEERMGCPLSEDEPQEVEVDTTEAPPSVSNGYSSLIGGGTVKKATKPKSRTELSEILLDKEALKTNEIIVIAMGDEARKRANEPGTLRVGAFGYPIPDATLALVDPETSLLCAPYTIGEIWVDSPSLSGGFWALPKHTETIFHARPYRFMEGNPTPVLVEPEFLRTGLLGCIVEGKIFVLGLYEDRIRQRVEWMEHGEMAEHRYFFVQHLVLSIMKTVPKIYDCSAFDSHVNGEYLPIILIETQAASTAPTTAGGPPRQLDIPFLESLSDRVIEVLYSEHHLRVYCVMITAPNTLPRVVKNGRREIGNMLCRREFESGSLPCVHVKFGIEKAVQNLPLGDDPQGGIFSPLSSQTRQDYVMMQDKQYSGVDYREVVIDDRTSTPLNKFTNIHDLMQWRVSRQAEELAYCTVDGRGKEGKGVNWRKFDLKVAAVALYLKNKVKVRPGDHLVLMYTHSEDFVFAVHACWVLGAIVIPMAPIDQNRLNEDAPALLHMISDFKVKAILVNADVDHLLKTKAVSQHVKQSAMILKISLPNIYNTTKPPKQSSGCREHKLTMQTAWVQSGYPALIWTYWTPDQRRMAVQMNHDTLMALCKVQKETCQMTSTRPVLGCVRSTIGLGFIHTCLMGIFLAAPTYLVSPVDFAANPQILFQTLSRYKIKDTYATSQMLDHAIGHGAGKNTGLHELRNLMISTDGRPRAEVYQKVRLHFAGAGLDRTAINTIYSHVLNPMVASRSYMCIEPIELWLDMNMLRRGLVVPVDPDTEPFALLVQDSGMVPVSTQLAIVNPETNRLCLVGEYGEIWVQSEANAHCFYGSKDPIDYERLNGRTVDGDPEVRYVRTGDLGFLHNVSRPIGPNGGMVEMQVLFVLGAIGDTFEVNGLNHFAMDIELSVEKCHRNIVPNGCAVIQAGGLVVLLVEIVRKNFLASLVPVIVNAVLNEHHLVTDIVAFVGKGDFPRSRLGEKQRSKILASWVTRKMRTIAQFAIRDPDMDVSQITEIPEGRTLTMQSRTPTGLASMKRPSSLKHELAANSMSPGSINLPPGIAEMPTSYQESIAELPDNERGGVTPTENTRKEFLNSEQQLHHDSIGVAMSEHDPLVDTSVAADTASAALHRRPVPGRAMSSEYARTGEASATFDPSIPAMLQPQVPRSYAPNQDGHHLGQGYNDQPEFTPGDDASPDPNYASKPFLDVEFDHEKRKSGESEDWPQEALGYMSLGNPSSRS